MGSLIGPEKVTALLLVVIRKVRACSLFVIQDLAKSEETGMSGNLALNSKKAV